MDSFELNKIIGAVLGTLLFVMGAGFVAEAIYAPIEGRGPGYALPEPEVAEHGAPADAAPEEPLGVLLAAADPARGATAVKKCAGCHNFGEGEGNKQGPALYGVVGRPEGGHEGFAYSEGMLAHNAAGDTWTYENLNAFLTKPSDYVPGTKMNFAGVRTAEERAEILAYLQTLSATPVPFPAPEAAPAAEGEAAPAAEGEAAAPADAAAPAAEPAAAPATEPAAAPAEPAAATETPATTATETPVEGTPTTTH
jgi:cytochrome c